jgi:hypothetical protein
MAHACWFGAIVEYMTQMGIATGAGDFVTRHAMRIIGTDMYAFGGIGFPEAGPSGAGIEFGFGAIEWVVA